MVGYNFFQTSTLGMQTNAHALNNIGTNIANVNTGGYKRTDTRFETILSQTLDTNQSDLGGVKPKDYRLIDRQGAIVTSSSDLDLAITGDGLFQLSTSLTSTDPEDLVYSRDGSFRILTSDITSSATADDGSTITVNNAYLGDKNGYYLLGWAPDAFGNFSSSDPLQSMRIDAFAFSTAFNPTTTATLGLNLPSNGNIVTDHATTVLAANNGNVSEDLETYTISVVDSNGNRRTAQMNYTKSATNQWEVSATTSAAATPQIDTVMIAGTIEPGDQFSLTVNGSTVSYTTTGAEADLGVVRDALVAALNGHPVIGNRVTATAGNALGEITITENPGTTTAQIDALTIAGTVEAGDEYTVTVDGIPVSYTVTGAEADLGEIRDGLLAAITANPSVSALVTAAAGGAAGEITLTAVNSGTAFLSAATANITGGTDDNTATTTTTLANDDGTSITTSASSVPAVAIAQVDTVVLGGTVEAGDQYSATINGFTVTYTVTGAEADLDAVRDNFVAAINNDVNTRSLVSTISTGPGTFTMTALAAGTPLLTSVSTPVTGGTADNTATLTNTTAAVAVANDNTILVGPNANYQTTPIQTITFSSVGEIISPDPPSLAFAFNFDDGATADVNLDMSQFTQFGDDFLTYAYDHNGYGKADLGRVSFDGIGQVIGNFSDGTQRAIYKIPLAQFSNPNGLDVYNGMVFRQSEASGTPNTFAVDETDYASFSPYAVEISNVDIATEFTKMMLVQNAYNSNATVFKTVDEMTMVARDLKA